MKSTCLTFTFSLLLLLSSLGLKAQNSITLSFNSTSNIDSVRIDNLDNASYKVLKDGTFSILLQFGLPNRIESVNVFGEPLVYPNPFKQQVNFEFSSINQNNVNLAVYDLSGKVVAQFNQKIDVGSHRFTFRPAKPGVYLMKVSDKLSVYTSTIICQESSSGQSGIEYVGLVDTSKSNSAQMVRALAPSSPDGFSANTGDLLRFTGYAGTKINSMYDFANSTKNYTFTFADRYFKFKNYNIQASKPCFVDVMFSVTDQNNKGVDYLTNSDFSVLEDNAPTSPSETFRYVRKIQQIPSKIKTVLLLDNSTSVSADIEAIKNAAIKFVQTIREGQEIAIYVFSDTPVLLQNFTTNKNLLETAIKSIGSGYPSTNLYGSIITGLSIWNDIYTLSSITQGSLIVFTDGSDTQGSSTLNSVISSRGDKKIYVIGLGSEINPAALNKIANPGPYFPIQKAGELDAVFATIQSDIVQFSNSFYWLNYMSPKRTGTHTLKVSAANNTNTTSTSYLTGSFSAAGFQSVKSGVYANIEDSRLYGLDTIRCFYSSAGYRFTYDANNLTLYSKDSLVLKPVTYWAFKPPVFNWTTYDTDVYQTTKSAYPQLTIKPVETKSDTSFIILNDEANNYTKKIIVISNPVYAELTTANPRNITYSSVTLGGEITNIGSSAVTERGVCFSTTANPTTANTKVVIGSGKGVFETVIQGLNSNTTYYIRSYAKNSSGTSYGNEMTLKTLNTPVLTTSNIEYITQSTVQCGGNITSDGGDAITARGVCWSTTSNPTIDNNKTVDGNGTGVFSSSITELTMGIKYYVRSYVTNNGGTTYGNELSFTITLPTVSTNPVTSIFASFASGSGNVLETGSTEVTSRGICWNTSSNPTIELTTKTVDGNGIGSFISKITGLSEETTYYARAYAANSIGVSYGNEVEFRTYRGEVTDAEGNFYRTIQIGNQEWMLENLKTTKYRNGDIIPTTTPAEKDISNEDIPKYQWVYNSDESNLAKYGRLYTWDVLNDPRNIAPEGWHVPTDAEWTILENYLIANGYNYDGTTTGNKIGKALASTTDWETYYYVPGTIGFNLTLNNKSGFTALPGGCRASNGNFFSLLSIGFWWSSTDDINGYPLKRSLYFTYSNMHRDIESKNYGLSVRCLKDGIPSLITEEVTNIGATSAICGGNIFTSPVSERGVCWSTSSNPTIDLSTKTNDGSGSGSFTSTLSGLSPSTRYYIRAYATNSIGTAYGPEISFTTHSGLISLTTSEIKNITASSATCGGVITDGVGSEVTVRGVCWSTNQNPTLSDSKTSDGSGIGLFTSSITGLNAETNYYVRAYATNSVGTFYGTQISFSTKLPVITTSDISEITSNTAKCGGDISNFGGSALIARGVCWSTKPNPTIEFNNFTSDGTEAGTFLSSITNLMLDSTYYVRAYATNSIGTVYGNEVSFTTRLAIGDSYLGGKVAYLDASGIHGFVCAPTDQSAGIRWNNGSDIKITGLSDEIHLDGVYGITKSAGLKNTEAIIIAQGEGNYAASICANLTLGGALPGEWYLPTRLELIELYKNKTILGGFSDWSYWSSTGGTYYFVYAYYGAIYVQLGDGKYADTYRDTSNRVRAIRAF